MIDPTKQTVEQILTRSVIYSVPDYQRAFEWNRENATEFWEDLNSGSFFLGTLIFDTSNKQTHIEVVDGQQRLTTIFILLAALRDKARSNENEDQARAIQDLISFKNNRTGVVDNSKFIASDKIRDVFDVTITNPKWVGGVFNVKNKRRQVNKIKPLYDYFASKVTGYSTNEIEDVLGKLYDAFAVVIEIEKTEEAFDIFERTNARGIDLNAADLLKNYLFQKLDLSDEEIKSRWDNIVERTPGNTLRMIKYYYVSKSGYISKKDLFKSLRVKGNSMGPESLLADIDLFSKHYAIISDASKDSILEWADEFDISEFRKEYNAEALSRSLQGIKLFNVTQAYPLLAKVMELVTQVTPDPENIRVSKVLLKFVRTIENFHFINSAIAQKQANTIEKFYADKCKEEVDSDTLVAFIDGIIENLKDQMLVSKQDFVSSFMNINYENDPILIYYINDRLNDHYLEATNPSRIYNTDKRILKRNHSIDHLVAQSNGNYKFEIDSETLHHIGNLLVITSQLNSRLGNSHIVDKLAILKEETTTLPEIKQLLGEWEGKEWDSPEAVRSNIHERAQNMANQCYEEVFHISK